MWKLIKVYIRRFYYTLRYIGPGWDRHMELLQMREKIEFHVDRGEATASRLMAALFTKGEIQSASEFNSLRAALVRSGHMAVASGEELADVRKEHDQLLDLAIDLGMVSADDADEIRLVKQSNSDYSIPVDCPDCACKLITLRSKEMCCSQCGQRWAPRGA